MVKGGGRPRDDEVWQHVKLLEGGRSVRCNYCGLEFAASANRIKSHISKDKGKGIRPCPEFPQSNNSGSCESNSKNDLEDNHGLENYTQGQIQDGAKDQERIQAAGSISVSNWENEDLQVIRYVSESLSSGDIVFQSPRLHLTQRQFTTLVKPGTCLDSWVIDAFVELLTDNEQKTTTPSNWYLPVRFSTAALERDVHDFKDFVEKHKMRETYMFAPISLEKVFIPVHIGPRLHGHFYLYIIHLKSKEIEIWDSLPKFVTEGDRIQITKRLLLAMEELFKEEGTSFTNIKTEMARDILWQPNKYDCGIFVIKFMEQSDNYVKRNHLFKFDSKKEREDLALKLLKSDLNQEKQNLYDKARRRYAQVEKQDGSKRLKVDSDERVNTYAGLQKALIGKNFERYVQRMWEWIMDHHVSAIGVWGMGGSGKTALASHIHDKLLEEASGDIKVIWVTVSQNNIYKLQKVIARSMKLDISDESEVKRIARKLFQAFKEMKRCVVILDDVWDHFFLKEVGFPMSDDRITLILTTRIWEVCQGMGCEKNTLAVAPLDEEDGWALFQEISGFHERLPREEDKEDEEGDDEEEGDEKEGDEEGDDEEEGDEEGDEEEGDEEEGDEEGDQEEGDKGLSSKVSGIAQRVASACEGLPLAIVRIATSMKGKKGAREWRDMLECLGNLGNGQYEMDKWVLPVLRSSYDFLNKKLQKFFLYYVLTANSPVYGDDVNHLIRRFVYESMDETKNFRVQYNEGYNMLDKLRNHSMLQRDDNRWRIHKFVRVLTFGIAEYSGEIMANTCKNLTEIPSRDRWKGDLQKVFLTKNLIQTIPNGIYPRCSQLSTLLLDCNSKLNYISDDFFKKMPALKMLDLSGTGIERLPESVSSLKYLVALLLSRCSELSCIPSLCELKRLMALDLSYTAITVEPMGLKSLVNLRCLNLLGTDELVISPSLISKLINLECLELHLTNVTVRCICGLNKLEVIEAHFRDVSVFNTCVRFMARRGVIKCYCLTLLDAFAIGHTWGEGRNREYDMKRITLECIDLGNGKAVLPRDMNELCIYECSQGRTGDRCLCSVLTYAAHNNNNNDAHQIERLDIHRCYDVEYLCCSCGSCPFCSSSQLVGSLSLFRLKDLKGLVSPHADSLHESTLFSHLTDLHIRFCSSMETLMTPKLTACLQNLRTITICECWGMKEMVGEDDSETPHPDITLPNLTSIRLDFLPELKSVYRGVMLCPSLQTFSAESCWRLDHPWIQISKGCVLQIRKGQFGGYIWEK